MWSGKKRGASAVVAFKSRESGFWMLDNVSRIMCPFIISYSLLLLPDSRYWHPLKSSWHPLLVRTLILVISACTVSTVVLSQVRREPPRGQQYGTYEKTRHNTRTCQAGIEINVSIEKWVGLINITSFHYSNGFYSADVGVKP